MTAHKCACCGTLVPGPVARCSFCEYFGPAKYVGEKRGPKPARQEPAPGVPSPPRAE